MIERVPRPTYERLLKETLDTPSIKVLTGIRRCGKSTLLQSLHAMLLDDGVPQQNILYKKLDSFDVPLEPTAEWLDDLLSSSLSNADTAHPLYVLLDEIQEVPNWERPVRRLHSSERARIYLTGSNASLLSSDLATYLSGRYIHIPVFPLSFSEYLRFQRSFAASESATDGQSPHHLLDRYIRFGGMPGLFSSTDFTERSVSRELSAIRDTVLLNDVAKRFSIRDIALLEKLLRYVYSTSGNLFSTNKVAGYLTSVGRKTNAETIDTYLRALQRAFALYECPQVGLKGKSILQPQRKFYAPDTGLRNLETGFKPEDTGFQLENVVYMELLRRGYEVNVGTLNHAEIDFVAQKLSERLYIQVCEAMLDDATRQREIEPLEAIPDAHPKLILTRDELTTGITDTGIRVMHLCDWLLEE